MDHHDGQYSTALKTEVATKPFFLQVFCLGWKMQHQDVCGEGRQNTSSCTSSPGLIALSFPGPHTLSLPSLQDRLKHLTTACNWHPPHSEVQTSGNSAAGRSDHSAPWWCASLSQLQVRGKVPGRAFTHSELCSDPGMKVTEVSLWLLLRLPETLWEWNGLLASPSHLYSYYQFFSHLYFYH